MDGPRDYHTKRSQTKTKFMYHSYVESKKMIEMNLQNRNRLTDIENTLMATKGKVGGRAVKQEGRVKHIL